MLAADLHKAAGEAADITRMRMSTLERALRDLPYSRWPIRLSFLLKRLAEQLHDAAIAADIISLASSVCTTIFNGRALHQHKSDAR